MDRQRMMRCLEQVAAYQASGQRANQWATANGVPLRALSSWCAHARRWQAQLDGVAYQAATARKSAAAANGFVAARVAPAAPGSIRVELHAGSTRVDMHWPLTHARELAAWVRELAR